MMPTKEMPMDTTKRLLLDQCARYPELHVQDLLKFLHQSVFGCGHFVDAEGGGLEFLRREAAECRDAGGPEPLDGGFVRFPLGLLAKTGLKAETLWRLFLLSAKRPRGTVEALEEKLSALLALAEEGALPFSTSEVETAIAQWRAGGFPAQHHSDAFRAAYAPAYRVIWADYEWMLPLLCAIDRKMASGKPILVALEGGSAAGKTTLASSLQEIYGCPVFHMDDFFLRPEQRTAKRLAQPGGNVDHERFWEEVLRPLRAGEAVTFRRYDCHTQTLHKPISVPPAPLAVVEGAYSCHPALYDAYDLRVFLRISPQTQRRRIQRRNTPDFQQRFFDVWIPMEQRYQDAFDIPNRCDLILEAIT